MAHELQIKVDRDKLKLQELRALFDNLKPWHHLVYVHGIPTKIESAWGEPLDHPLALWKKIKPCLPVLHDKKILDVGCNDGFFVFKCRQLGASSVLGVEVSPHFYNHAVLLNKILRLGNCEFKLLSAYDIEPSLGSFDITLLLGVFYHLKNPLKALEKISAVTTELLILESAIRNSNIDIANRKNGVMGEPMMEFVNQPTEAQEPGPNWWIPNTECLCSIMQFCGFSSVEVCDEYILPPPTMKNTYGRVLLIGKKDC